MVFYPWRIQHRRIQHVLHRRCCAAIALNPTAFIVLLERKLVMRSVVQVDKLTWSAAPDDLLVSVMAIRQTRFLIVGKTWFRYRWELK
ncbi:MAG: hypothetical protein ABSE80_14785 [Halobacteriota archaeon]|jgi:hypothetical protein